MKYKTHHTKHKYMKCKEITFSIRKKKKKQFEMGDFGSKLTLNQPFSISKKKKEKRDIIQERVVLVL